MSDIEENSVEETEEVGASTTEERDGKEQGSAIEQKPEKKYTDADVDRIVSKRLNREREKLSKALGEGQKESELEIRERKVLERELSIEVMVAHPCATVAPTKLEDYKVHQDPPGISGDLVEGRIVYDAFILENKKKAIYYQENKAAV